MRGKREKNEDACIACKIGDFTFFLAIADGMGGKAGGDIASNLVISSVRDYLQSVFENTVTDSDLKIILEKAFLLSQTAVADNVSLMPELRGMGTTLSVILIHNYNYVWGNIGDSRIYLLHGEKVKLITEDHTYVADYLKSGKKELPQNILSQYNNMVTRIVDGGTDRPDIYPSMKECERLTEGDILLICSDGLVVDKTSDMSQKLREIINKKSSLRRIVKKLINWALDNGSDDNVTIVIGKYGSFRDEDSEEDPKTIRIVLEK